MNDNKIKLPKKNDKFFKSDHNWWHDACVGLQEHGWDAYAEGFKMAADIIVKNYEDFDKNFLVFPIVFLYRQYLELRLKEIIIIGYSSLNKDKKIHFNHDILILWYEVRKIIMELWPDQSEYELEAIDGLIKEFSRADPASYCFRYPEDKNRKTFHYDIMLINLENLSEVIEKIANIIDGASIGISEMSGFRDEI